MEPFAQLIISVVVGLAGLVWAWIKTTDWWRARVRDGLTAELEQIGRIAQALATGQTSPPPLIRRLERFSRHLGVITMVLIAHSFSREVQGYYYTFWGMIGLQIFFELGFPQAISKNTQNGTARQVATRRRRRHRSSGQS